MKRFLPSSNQTQEDKNPDNGKVESAQTIKLSDLLLMRLWARQKCLIV